jgi:hypothetical protein
MAGDWSLHCPFVVVSEPTDNNQNDNNSHRHAYHLATDEVDLDP